jgi:cellulose synthase/poly-beta-1,6-N-acetylglucosamine synthase-like glycosyltransferase
MTAIFFRSVQGALLLLQALAAGMAAYLLLLTAAAWQAARRTPLRPGAPNHRFLILIPAHNEERLLPASLASLNKLAYPRSLFAVHVIADNCRDNTAAVAQQFGATVHERYDQERRGKGYALQWLIQQLWQSGEPYDAVVILDADTVVSTNFLQVMDARLTRGERVIQAYYAVRDPGSSWSVTLRYAALAVLHYLRPLGRMALGGSAGLKGNGMVFAAPVLRQHQWTAALTEDIEFHMDLILSGERVMFAPDAVVWAEMPNSLADAHTQNVRWERGRVEMARRYVPRLLREALAARKRPVRGQSFLLFDAAMEHIIPPFSILVGTNGLALLAAVLLPSGKGRASRSRLKGAGVALGTAALAGQLIYLFAGLHLARAPRSVYRALVYAPWFMVWKGWLYLRVLLGRDRDGWIRTTRNLETPAESEGAEKVRPLPEPVYATPGARITGFD